MKRRLLPEDVAVRFLDRELGCRIDNGNHMVLSGNVAVQDYLYLSHALDTMGGPGAPIFPFIDFSNGERWTIKMNKGTIPWWVFSKTAACRERK